MDKTTVTQTVREYILGEFLPGESPDNLAEDTPLLSGGIVDSIGTLKLVGFLEERFGVTVEAHEMNEENLDTVALITHFVLQRTSR